MNTTPSDPKGMFDNPDTVKWILRVFYAVCVLLVALDFVVHRHIYTDIERIPTFYALYGFVACVALVLVAKLMRKVLMREETFYDADAADDQEGSDVVDQ